MLSTIQPEDIPLRVQKPKVLIVEDESVVAEDIKEKLETLGYSIIGVTDSGREAIELAKRHSPDLVMMDIHIKTDLNGVEAAICIQGLFERTIPIVFVSGYSVQDFPDRKSTRLNSSHLGISY